MHKYYRRLLAGALAVSMVLGSTMMAAAEEITQLPETTKEAAPEETTEEEPENTKEEVSATALKNPEIKYVYVESSQIAPGEAERIVFSFEDVNLRSAKLEVKNISNGQTVTMDADKVVANTALFEEIYTKEGSYEIEGLTYTIEGNEAEFTYDPSKGDKETSTFSVEKISDAECVEKSEKSSEDSVFTIDVQGLTPDGEQIAAAIENAVENQEDEFFDVGDLARNKGEVVVVLDAGHDSTHHGAYKNGYREEDLTIKIAKYCKQELLTYSNVKVYMTRDGSACPFPGTSSGDDNAYRVEYAASVGADIYVALHLNSSSGSANGAIVYKPNYNYMPWIGTEGNELAWKIEDELLALGLNQQSIGVAKRDSESGDRYDDGSLADYYAVIRKSKQHGFPGVIVEHAFLSSWYDIDNFLDSDEKLKRLGVADATGIAKYFKLSKGPNSQTEEEGYSLYSDVADNSGWRFEAVQFVTYAGIMNGISGTTKFDPNGNLSRAMFATIIYRMLGEPWVDYNSVFDDVPDGRYFSAPIIWANREGIINGYGGTKLFGTNDDITRQDLVTILYRYVKYIDYDNSRRADISSFPDGDTVSYYAKDAMSWAVANGIIKGRSDTGMIDPKGNATRVECAAIVQRFMSEYEL